MYVFNSCHARLFFKNAEDWMRLNEVMLSCLMVGVPVASGKQEFEDL